MDKRVQLKREYKNKKGEEAGRKQELEKKKDRGKNEEKVKEE